MILSISAEKEKILFYYEKHFSKLNVERFKNVSACFALVLIGHL